MAGLLRYASGALIPVPGAQHNLASLVFQNTRMNRVEGQPLFLKDPNCHCLDPRQDFVLNPAAWSDSAPGQFGTSKAFYDDYRLSMRTFNSRGEPSGGFGFINPTATPGVLPRNGQVVARFQF